MERTPSGRVLRVALVQGGIDRDERFKPELARKNLEHYLALTRSLLPEQPDLIVWPEYAIEFPLRFDPVAQLWVAELSKSTRATLLVGGPDLQRAPQGPRGVNSAFAIQGGRVTGRYDKVDLMPFSEWNPLPDWLQPTRERARFTPGTDRSPLELAGVRVAVLLCSEAMHPARTRDAVRRGAELIVNPSNDDWFAHPSAQRQQLLAVSLRAIESRRWVIRVAASGPSAVIDPLGRIEWVSPTNVPATTVREIRLADRPPDP
jgi:apolipoprotein N-acyltransferase